MASGSGNCRGRTSVSWVSPMFFMERATARCCPGGRVRSARCECRGSPSGRLALDVFPAWAHLGAPSTTDQTSLVTVQPLLNIAVRAARSAGEVIIRSLNRVESLKVTAKGRNDFVTEVDQAAEAEISSGSSSATTPATPSSPRKAGRAGTATRCGSSTRSMAPRTSCTASRCSPSRSPARSRAGPSTRSSTTRMRGEIFSATRGRRAPGEPAHTREQGARA